MEQSDRRSYLVELIRADLARYGQRRPWAYYSQMLFGDETHAERTRMLWKRAMVSAARCGSELVAKVADVPTTAAGANQARAYDPPKLADFIEHARKGVELHDATSCRIQRTEVFIKSAKPIAIANMADFHLGSAGCDHQQWAADYDYLTDAVGLYAIFNGDLTENCVGFPDARGMVTQVLSPEEQDELMYQALEALNQRKKIIAVTAGNHDHGRDARLVGRSFISNSCKRLGVPFFHGYGIVDVLVGPTRAKAQKYTITASHTGLGSSMYNKVHGANRLWQKTRTDIVFTAHLHQPCLSLDVEGGQKRLLAQAGTHNTSAEYALYKYKGGGWTAWPTVVLFPDVHDFVGFLCPRMAMKVVNNV